MRPRRICKTDAILMPIGSATSYQLLLPLHALWLGYISELLNLELRKAIPPPQAMTTVPQEASTSAATQADSSSNNIAAMVGAAPDQGSSNYTLQQMQMWQGKLVKADFHGCEIEGMSTSGCSAYQNKY